MHPPGHALDRPSTVNGQLGATCGAGSTVAVERGPRARQRRLFCHRASLVAFRRFEGDTVWCPIETAAYDLKWPVGDLATQLLGSNGMSSGSDNENQTHTAKSQACVSL